VFVLVPLAQPVTPGTAGHLLVPPQALVGGQINHNGIVCPVQLNWCMQKAGCVCKMVRYWLHLTQQHDVTHWPLYRLRPLFMPCLYDSLTLHGMPIGTWWTVFSWASTCGSHCHHLSRTSEPCQQHPS
jgi:hypothetical protein